MANTEDDQPFHVRQTAQAIAELHASHHRNATRAERWLEHAASRIATPAFLIVFSLAVFGWTAFNGALAALGHQPIDPPPYSFLQGLLTLLAVYFTLSILIVQRRAAMLADLRAQVTLEHSILTERKAAKVIELLEELRRDDPLIENRADHQAAALSSPADPQKVAAAILDSHAEVEKMKDEKRDGAPG